MESVCLKAIEGEFFVMLIIFVVIMASSVQLIKSHLKTFFSLGTTLALG